MQKLETRQCLKPYAWLLERCAEYHCFINSAFGVGTFSVWKVSESRLWIWIWSSFCHAALLLIFQDTLVRVPGTTARFWFVFRAQLCPVGSRHSCWVLPASELRSANSALDHVALIFVWKLIDQIFIFPHRGVAGGDLHGAQGLKWPWKPKQSKENAGCQRVCWVLSFGPLMRWS